MKIIGILLIGLLTVVKADKTGRVVGGIVAKKDQYTYTAAVKNENGVQICGGAILNNRWIVSAAHCTTENLTSIGVGDIVLSKQKNYAIAKIIPHKKYNETTGENDILLLQTAEDIVFDKHTSYINMTSQKDEDSYPTHMVFTGWGLISSHSFVQPDILIHLSYHRESQQDCVNKNCEAQSPQPFYFKSQFCARGTSEYYDEAGFCEGDTGSPLVSPADGMLYGIASRLMKEPCTSGYPDVFTSIGSYNNWINKNINQ